jgi:Mannose-1-phosphate guanylyltransferase
MNEKTFLDTVSDAMNYASTNDNLYTLGIKPTRPETAYGYIQKNSNNFQNINGRPTYSVKTFTEKPSEELAKELINSGEFLWNSGIFIWNLKAIITELEKYLPDIAFLFKKGIPLYYTPNETSFIKSVYEECTGISIDYGVMEKTDKSWVFESSFGWSDLGTWHSLYAYSKKDEQNNMVNAQKVMINQVTNSLIVSKEKNKLIVINGLEDYMVVNTDDVLMICPRNEKNIKNILTDLALNDLTDFQ